jgi:hypothetical protein
VIFSVNQILPDESVVIPHGPPPLLGNVHSVRASELRKEAEAAGEEVTDGLTCRLDVPITIVVPGSKVIIMSRVTRN